MTDFKINNYILQQEAKQLAAQALLEQKEYGTDAQQLLHEMCDGHEWVIYFTHAVKLCAECDTNEGENYLEDLGYEQFDSFSDHATQLAYATLLGACYEAYTELQDEEED